MQWGIKGLKIDVNCLPAEILSLNELLKRQQIRKCHSAVYVEGGMGGGLINREDLLFMRASTCSHCLTSFDLSLSL